MTAALGPVDLHLLGEGRHERLWEKLGAHRLSDGSVQFAVWAPNAASVSVVGDWNEWQGHVHPLTRLYDSGVWTVTVAGVEDTACYKFEVRAGDGTTRLKADPFAFLCEEPPRSASRLFTSRHIWNDDEWMAERAARDPLRSPVSIYEVHLGSWRQPASYRDLAPALAEYCDGMGFTHVELLPIAEHPFGGSWGYQVSAYFAPSSRWGSPDDFRFFVDHLHSRGLGVIVDWVPAHFPRDDHLLARFDGTALYEHEDPRRGAHPDWGTLIFNYGRHEVRNFLLANALFWLEEFHVDGLRVDAVASMLYLDYSRKEGEWVPNPFGGREDLDAIGFLRELNTVVHAQQPGALSIAEESTAWQNVSRPVYVGGLGFTFKWNMGWMHDTLAYTALDPVHRRYHHDKLTFGLLYAWSENFILPLSHDEVVHGKGSLLGKMSGDRWQRFASLRALYAHMWAHPGKKLLFMGGEIAQEAEWDHGSSLDWACLADRQHQGVQVLVRDLNRVYRAEPALWEVDFHPDGFQWIDPHGADENVLSYIRWSKDGLRHLVCVVNWSPVVRHGQRVGVPRPGSYREVLNTDAAVYGGSNVGNLGAVVAYASTWRGFPASIWASLPPLAAVWLVPEG